MRKLLAIVALATAVATPAHAQESRLGITKPVQLTKADTAPTRTYGTPFVALDREQRRHPPATRAGVG